MIKRTTMYLALLSLWTLRINAQIDTSVINALQRFKTQNGADWQFRINEKTGIPASIHFGELKKSYFINIFRNQTID